ncbi:MAG: nucleotidyltransferase [Planctomycetota bacterium]
MLFNPDFKEMLFALSDAKIDFMLVGAYAVAAHGHPRATGDLDLWVRPDSETAPKVYRVLAEFGAPLHELTIDDLSRPGIVFQIGVEPSRIDILTAISGVEFDHAWANRLAVELDGIPLSVISRADLIVNKRACGRPKDIADAETLDPTDS